MNNALTLTFAGRLLRIAGAIARLGAPIITSALMLAPVANSAPSDLDTSFGSSGVALRPGLAQENFTKVLLQPDGKIVASTGLGIIARFNQDGSLDGAFGGAAFLDGQGLGVGAIALQSDGKIVLALNVRLPDSTFVFGLVRFNADGSLDSGFGVGGSAQLPANNTSDLARGGLFVLPDGRILIVGSSWANGQLPSHPRISFARFLPNGAPDASLGTGGRLISDVDIDPNVVSVINQPDGKWVVAASAPYVEPGPTPVVIARFLSDCTSDASFGTSGSSTYPYWVGPTGSVSVAVQTDGRIVVAGWPFTVASLPQFAVVRLLEDGRLDTTFGNGGIASIQVGEPGPFGEGKPGTYSGAHSVLLQPDGRILIAGSVYLNMDDLFPARFPQGPFLLQRVGLARLLPDGTPDLYFGGGGVTTEWSGFGANAYALALQTDGRIVVAGDIQLAPTPPGPDPLSGWVANPAPAVFRFLGGNSDLPRTLREARAIEYFHTGFGHYFITSAPKEIMALDTLLYAGQWARTGLGFKVWAESAGDLSAVCRFFSDQSFAPKSSHFYTPNAAECDALKSGSVWEFEGLTFYLRLPNQGACPTDTRPLYRVYNNGQGGAPNHRYTTDRSVRDAMVSGGWIAEGDGPDVVAMCALPQ